MQPNTNHLAEHVPVMLQQTVAALAAKPDGNYVDGTFGRGGHARMLLEMLGSAGHLSVFDRDPEAIASAQSLAAMDERVRVYHADFAQLQSYLPALSVDGVMLDLGVSSPQLDQAERGFSFMRDGPLDMRMDTSRGEPASSWLASVELDPLTRVLREYGEEPQARKIAIAIVAARGTLHTTKDLANLVEQSKGRGKPGRHPATQVFQAVRIAINRELDSLLAGLSAAHEVMKIGARLAVISFHSLEDRIVKQFMAERAKAPPASRRDFMAADLFTPSFQLIGKAIRASDAEAKVNPRARSAVLRIAEKLA
jgi:16S rRNA (cytosine1402-N4)-methyltransferase